MRKSLLLILILMLVLPTIIANDHISTKYTIVNDITLARIELDNAINKEIILPYGAEIIEINTYYEQDGRIISVSGNNIVIEYTSKAYVDKAGYKYYFTLTNPIKDKSSIALYLPEGAILIDDLVLPKYSEIDSDGKNIILRWNDFEQEQIVVSYGFIEDDDWHYLVIIGALTILIIGIQYYNKNKFKKEIKKVAEKSKTKKSITKKKEDLTKNLYEDEKKIVEFLLSKKKNEAWTKEIVKGLDISKVKLSRKLRSLEAKEVIKRIPYGNENRIRLLK